MVAYAAGFAALSTLRHLSFTTGRFDLGNMVQAVWATAHGHPLAITDLQGEQISRLGAHVDPILVAFAPLWWLWPSPVMLLTVQAVAVALGALPVFWLARKHLESERAALGFALAYLLYPAVQWLTLNEFHPVALATPFLLFAIWYLDEDRLLAFAVFAAAACLCKEEIPLVVAALGGWYALARRRRVPGAVIAVAGVAVAAIAIGVVTPHFNEGASSAFYGRYDEVGGSPSGILETAVTDPGRLLSVAFDERGLRYLAELVLPLALLCILSPLALVAAPELAINLLSATPTQTSIHFHYTAGAIPGARRRERFRGRIHRAAPAGPGGAACRPGASRLAGGELSTRTAAVLARASRRRDAAGLRDSCLRPRQGGGSGGRRRAGGCRRQRDELARRPSLGSPARAELPVCPRRAMDRG